MENALEPGASIGPHKIVRLLGRGGMGEVYEAFDPTLDRRLAIKVISKQVLSTKSHPEITNRFFREARILAQVNHPNVVTIHGIEVATEPLFIAMEYIDGVQFNEMFKLFS